MNTTTLTRRRLIRGGAGIALSTPFVGLAAGCEDGEGSGSASSTAATTAAPAQLPRSGREALDRLLAGNERFVEGRSTHQGQDSVRRAEIAQGQNPFAIVLACSDSRVPPEIVFDQGLGDLFVVRVAGNTASDPLVVGSIEYAAEHLGSVLLMVLGHESCGAVAAAVEEVTAGTDEPGSIPDLIAPIAPVVEGVVKADPDLDEEKLLEHSVTANVEHTVGALNEADPLISGLVAEGTLTIVGAEYELQTGEVKLVSS